MIKIKNNPSVVLAVGILTIVFNTLINLIQLNGQSTAAVSDKYMSQFTPAGSTFAIWGIIYVGWLLYGAYHFTADGRKDVRLNLATGWYVVSGFANVLWLVLWHYEQLGLSVLMMSILLYSLLQVYTRLQIGQSKPSLKRKWLVELPISIYLGWISVATIGNVASALVQSNWPALGISPTNWSLLLILIAGILGVLMLLRRSDYAYNFVLVWALWGIAKNFNVKSPEIYSGAIAVLLFLLISMSIKYISSRYLFTK